MAKIKGTTESGFEFEIDKEALTDDWELLEAIEEVCRGSNTGFVHILNRLFDRPQAEQLKEHCRNESGRISIERMSEELIDIIKSARKNS